ncbi:MAG: hypothetical protein V4562_05305 [Pseudomonadota bacterium]
MTYRDAVLLLMFAVQGMAFATTAGDTDAAERARIERSRAQAEARFLAEESACYQKFAVNACLEAAKGARRQTLGTLRREENQLNDARRKRDAAARLEDIAERSSPETLQRAQERRDRALEASGRRTQRLQAIEAARGASAAEAPRPPRQAPPAGKAASAADNAGATAQENKFTEAQRRKDRRDKKRADKNKPPAAPLPDPR